jgi:3-dehydroquinate synthase
LQTIELNVELPGRSYPIVIGSAILRDRLVRLANGRQVCLITDTTVAGHYLESATAALCRHSIDLNTITLAPGEGSKTLATVSHIFDSMLAAGLGRDALVVALGGGVVGDIAGFAAACFLRGVDLIQVPTTLLAQVDSSVGGKSGVNHPLGKNLIGAFHQPRAVLVDIDTLSTLPPRQFTAGLAEVIKYGLGLDAAFFTWLEDNLGALQAQDPEALQKVIRRCCELKAAVVSADEREAGHRALLNLGHTFGHAIEAGLGFGHWLHGEAVAAGMCLAADLSARMEWMDDAAAIRTRELITAAGLPANRPAELDGRRMLELMHHDKKVREGQLRLVLLRAIGDAVITSDYPRDLLSECLTG